MTATCGDFCKTVCGIIQKRCVLTKRWDRNITNLASQADFCGGCAARKSPLPIAPGCRALTAVLLLATAIALPAQAEHKHKPKPAPLHFDFESLTRIAIQYARATPAPEARRAFTITGATEEQRSAPPAITLAPEQADPLTPLSAQFDDVAAGHRIHWHYDERWSGTVSSDYPQVALPIYRIGNGAPGLPQNVWLKFTLVRSFF